MTITSYLFLDSKFNILFLIILADFPVENSESQIKENVQLKESGMKTVTFNNLLGSSMGAQCLFYTVSHSCTLCCKSAFQSVIDSKKN